MAPQETKLFAEWEKDDRPYPWTAAQFTETLRSTSSQTLVWDEDGKVIGYGVLQIVAGEAHLLNFMIEKKRWRQGKGLAWITMLLAWVRERGIKRMILDVDAKNEPAIKLYEKAGFQTLEKRAASYPNGEDAIVMKKDL
jgi:ribosomal-protein-alanine N-acetyltransferase